MWNILPKSSHTRKKPPPISGTGQAKSQRAVENREKWRKMVVKSSVVHQQLPRLKDGRRLKELSGCLTRRYWGKRRRYLIKE